MRRKRNKPNKNVIFALCKKKSMISSNAIQYTLSHLLKVAFPMPEPPGFVFEVAENSVTVTLAEHLKLRMAQFSNEETALFCNGNAQWLLHHIRSADELADIPVFQPVACTLSRPVLNENGELEIPYDFTTPSFFLLSRAEEHNGQPRDSHDRFRYEESLAHHYGFIHLPLVDEYALLLRKWVMEILKANWTITPRKHQLIPTHDIDLLYRFQFPWQAFKSIVGRDLLLEHNWRSTVHSVHEYRQWRIDSRKDPYITAILELIRQAEERNLPSVFFFKAQHNGEPDSTYDIDDPRVRYCIEQIQKAGMTVGLHGSYESYNNPKLFAQEKERLERITGSPITHCRQHYLRYGAQTQHVWQASGITDDFTLCYAEQPGFRCGTCHPYPLYDTEKDCITHIIEHPLIVMDGSLFDYLHLDIQKSNNLIDNILQQCQAVEGDFVILWHNHLLSRSYRKLYKNIYLPLINNYKP